MFIMEFKVHR